MSSVVSPVRAPSPRKSAWDDDAAPKTVERLTSFNVVRPSYKVKFGFNFNSSAGKRNVVTMVQKKSPADGSVQKNDRIVKVNAKDVKLMSQSEIESFIDKHLHIKLTVARLRMVARKSQKVEPKGQLEGENENGRSDDIISPVRKGRTSASRTPRTPATSTRDSTSRRSTPRTTSSSSTTPRRTPSHRLTLATATAADLAKELRARKGAERQQATEKKEREKKAKELVDKHEVEKQAIETALAHADSDWTPLQKSSLAKAALIKVERQRKAEEEHKEEEKRIELSDKLTSAKTAFPKVEMAVSKPNPFPVIRSPSPLPEEEEEEEEEEVVFDKGDPDFTQDGSMRVRVELISSMIGFSLNPPEGGSTIINIKPQSDLAKDGRVQDGFVLIAVGGVDVRPLGHPDRIRLLKQAAKDRVLDLTVELAQEESDVEESDVELRHVWVHKGANLGFSIGNKKSKGPNATAQDIFIWKMQETCQLTTTSDRDSEPGTMNVGDHLIKINDTSILDFNPADVITLLSAAASPIKLTVTDNEEGFLKTNAPAVQDNVLVEEVEEVKDEEKTEEKEKEEEEEVAPFNYDGHSRSTATITRSSLEESFGFGVGSMQCETKVVTAVRPNTPAAGKLVKGDVIVSLDGHDGCAISHIDIVARITDRLQVVLEIARDEEMVEESEIIDKLSISMSRNATNDWGFRFKADADGRVVVLAVMHNSPAASKLCVGDELSTVQGRNVAELEYSEAENLVNEGTELMLGITRVKKKILDAAVYPADANSLANRQYNMWHVQFSQANDHLGFKLDPNSNPLQIGEIQPGGCADGILAVNDEILSIEGKSAPTQAEAMAFFQFEFDSTTVSLTIRRRIPRLSASAQSSRANSDDGVLVAKDPKSRPSEGSTYRIHNRKSLGDFEGGETTEHVFTLTKLSGGSYGFAFVQTSHGAHVVKLVQPGGCADKKLQLHDHIQSVNGQQCKGLNADEVTEMIGDADSNTATIIVERYLQVIIQRSTPTASFGFGLGSTDANEKIVTSVTVDGPADGKLVVTDTIAYVDGSPVDGIKHHALVGMFTGVLETTLNVARHTKGQKLINAPKTGRLSISAAAPQINVTNRRNSIGRQMSSDENSIENVTVILIRKTSSDSFGFALGSTFEEEKIVTKVTERGLSDGKLQIADKILTVDGTSVVSLHHADVVELFRNVLQVQLQVSRDKTGYARTVNKSFANADNTDDKFLQRRSSIGRFDSSEMPSDTRFVVQETVITRAQPNSTFGFGIATTFANEKLVSIVAPIGHAKGKLIPSDKLLQINDVHVSSLNHNELIEMLAPCLQLKIVFARDSQLNSTDTPRSSISQTVNPQRITNRFDQIGSSTSKTVVVKRPSTDVGFGFGFGSTSEGLKVVSSIKENGAAAGLLETGDMILSIDGTYVDQMEHSKMLMMFTDVLEVTVKIQRNKNGVTLSTSKSARPSLVGVGHGANHHTITITRAAKGTSFGFGLGSTLSNEKLITTVNETGLAFGKIEVADKVLKVNDIYVSGMEHNAFIEYLTGQLSLTMLIERCTDVVATLDTKSGKRMSISQRAPQQSSRVVNRKDSIGRAPNLVSVALVRSDASKSFGFGISTSASGTMIKTVGKGSPSRDKLYVQDMLVSVDGQSVHGLTQEQVPDLLQGKLQVTLVVSRNINMLLEEEEEEYSEFNVTITRASLDDTWGLGIGTAELSNHKEITDVVANGPGDGKVNLCDVIVSVNGVDVTPLSHLEFINSLGKELKLEMRITRDSRQLSEVISRKQAQLVNGDLKMVHVTVRRVEKSFGFGYVGSSTGAQVVVRAEQQTLLEIGDQIVECNGLAIARGNEAHNALLAATHNKKELNLVVLRGSGESLPISPADVPQHWRSVTISRSANQSWGITIRKLAGHHVITSIAPGSPVASVLTPGDALITVDNTWLTAEHSDLEGILGNNTELDIMVAAARRVSAKKKKGVSGWGIGFTSDVAHTVDNTVEGLPLHGLLSPGDTIVGVGTKIVTEEKHEQVAQAVVNCGDNLVLLIHPATEVRSTMRVEIGRDANGFGLSLGTTNNGTHEVVGVTGASVNKVAMHDRVVGINGTPVHGTEHTHAIELIKASESTLALDLQRSARLLSCNVERSSTTDHSWGFGLGRSTQGNDYITNVSPDSPAMGVLEAGDLVDAVNGKSLDHMDHESVVAMLMEATSILITVFRPVSAAANGASLKKTQSISYRRPDLVVSKRNSNVGSSVVIPPRDHMESHTFSIQRPSRKASFGFGMAATNLNSALIWALDEGGPAVGKVQNQDVITHVDGQEVSGMPHDDIVTLLSSKDLQVDVTVLRARNAGLSKLTEEEDNNDDEDEDEDENEDELNEIVVTVRRDPVTSSYGFGIGHTDREECLITSVPEDGSSYGKLAVADLVLEVAGRPIAGMSHSEVIAEIVACEDNLNMLVRRGVGAATPKVLRMNRRSSITQVMPGVKIHDREDNLGQAEVVSVTLNRSSLEESFGFGFGEREIGCDQVIVKIAPGGVADGSLFTKDVMSTVDGTTVAGLSHEEVVNLIKDKLCLTLNVFREVTVRRRSSTRKLVQAPDGKPVRVEWEVSREALGRSFGFGIGTTMKNEKIITHVNPDGPAAGVVFVADRFVTVNGTAVEGLEHTEVLKLFTTGLKCAALVERNLEDENTIDELEQMAKAKRRVSVSEIPELKSRIKARRESVGRLMPIDISDIQVTDDDNSTSTSTA